MASDDDLIVGRGAYGEVRRGIWKPNNCEVALKIAEMDLEVPKLMAEAEILSRLDHPNVVKAYGLSQSKNGMYLVLEYAEDGSLHDVIHMKPEISYNLQSSLKWMLQCAQGLAYMHNMKPHPIVHRDLKSPNLLLSNHYATLKIADFGGSSIQRTLMTAEVGTAAWMAPEVITGQHYDCKCDVFSFGIIMWELLSRKMPYSDFSKVSMAIMYAVAHNNRRPSWEDDYNEDVKQLIERCWHSDSKERPAMTEIMKIVSDMLEEFKDNETSIISWSSQKSESQSEAATDSSCFVSPFSSVETDKSGIQSDTVSIEMGNSKFIKRVTYPGAIQNEVTLYLNMALELANKHQFDDAKVYWEKALQELRPDGYSPSIQTRIMLVFDTLGQLYTKAGKYEDAQKLALNAISSAIKVYGKNHSKIVSLLCNRAVLFVKQNNSVEAVKYYKKAVDISEILLRNGKKHIRKQMNHALIGLGALYVSQKLYVAAEQYFQKALYNADKLKDFEKDHTEIGNIYRNLGEIYLHKELLIEAEQYYKKALREVERVPNPTKDNQTVVSKIMFDLEKIYTSMERYHDLIPILRKLLCITKKDLGENHHEVCPILYRLAIALSKEGKWEDAEHCFKRAIELFDPNNACTDEERINKTTITLIGLAKHYAEYKKHNGAIMLFEKALVYTTMVRGNKNPEVAKWLVQLADWHLRQGNSSDANRLFDDSISIYKNLTSNSTMSDKEQSSVDPKLAEWLVQLADLHLKQGNSTVAERLLVDAINIYRTHSSTAAVPTEYRDALQKLGLVYTNLGKLDDAEPLFKEMLGLAKGESPQIYGTVMGMLEHNTSQNAKKKKLKRNSAIAVDFRDPQIVMLTATLNGLGALYAKRGLLKEAKPYLTTSLAFMKCTLGEDHPDVGKTLLNLGELYQQQRNTEEAEKCFRDALTILESGGSSCKPLFADCLVDLGIIYANSSRQQAAVSYFEVALNIRRMMIGDNHIDLCSIINNLATLYRHLERLEESKRMCQMAIGIYDGHVKSNGGIVSPNPNEVSMKISSVFFTLASIQESQRDFQQAKENYHHAIKKFEMARESPNEMVVAAQTALGNLYAKTKHFLEAKMHLMQALHNARKLYGDSHPDVLSLMTNIGTICERENKLDEAYKFYKEAMNNFPKNDDRCRTKIENVVYKMGNLCMKLEKFGRAEILLHRCLRAKQDSGATKAELAKIQEKLCETYSKLGKLDDAKRAYLQYEELVLPKPSNYMMRERIQRA